MQMIHLLKNFACFWKTSKSNSWCEYLFIASGLINPPKHWKDIEALIEEDWGMKIIDVFENIIHCVELTIWSKTIYISISKYQLQVSSCMIP